MRKLMTLTLASTAIVAIACGKDKSPTSTAMSADLKRDLQLASTTQDIRISPDEVAPTGKPEAAVKLKKAPQAPKVIRTSHPTVAASPKPVEQAEIPAPVPEVQVAAEAAPTPATEADAAPPLARPTAAPVGNAGGNGQGNGAGTGNAGNGGIGGILGGIFGAVIRGGVVGDDDHCDPRAPRRGHGRPVGGDVIYGSPGSMGGILGGISGMGGARIPTRGRP